MASGIGLRLKWAGILCVLCLQEVFAQCALQTVTLRKGWNAFYLQVEPTQLPDVLFANWPVDAVSMYDADAYLQTRQETSSLSDEPTPTNPFFIWRRASPSVASLNRLQGNAVYVCYNKEDAFSTVVYGRPVAPRLIWHKAQATDETLNYIGISAQTNTFISPFVYLKGCNAGYTDLWKIGGVNESSISLIKLNDREKVSFGDVVLANAVKGSEWSGALYITPQRGVDFGTTEYQKYISVRNDGPSNSTVEISWNLSGRNEANGLPPALFRLLYRDVAGLITNSEWSAFTSLRKNLAAGETWKLELGLDRTQFEGISPGTIYAGLVRFLDVDGGSSMSAEIPLTATVQAISGNDWPAGLWAADLTLANVSRVLSDASIVDSLSAGAPVKARIYLHVDREGVVRLLQRVNIAGDEASDGAADLQLYAGTASLPETAKHIVRLSSVVMPVDVPVVRGTGSFLQSAEFRFDVVATSPSNPFRHPYHPGHDGLLWDFKTPAPDGNNMTNYVSSVKPELFGVGNTITLTWNSAIGAAAWNPEESLTGTCSWRFKGLRHEGDLLADGTFVMRRIVKNGTIIE